MRKRPTHIIRYVLLLLMFLNVGLAKAQVVEGERVVRASLLVEQSDYSRPFYVGIQFDLSPGWYLYWINPGDSGLPVEVTWELPGGFVAGSIDQPVPEKYVSAESVSFGFKRELLLLCKIQPPPTAGGDQDLRIRVSLDWLVCKESCVRGTADLSVDLRHVRPSQQLTPAHIERVKASLPRDISLLDLAVAEQHVTRDGQSTTLSLQFSGNDMQRISDFYPEIIDGFTIEHTEISLAGGKLTLPLTAHSRQSALKRVRGLLIMGREGYVLDIPIFE